MQYPPLAHWQRYPVTTGIGLAAVAITAWTGFGEHINPLWRMDGQFWSGQIWRPFTCCLMHGDIFHLLFNLYWLWIFGTAIEEVLYSARMFVIVLFLALGSSLAQYAFSGSGIGLSGVGYGLFGLLWILHRRDRRFYDKLDDSTVKLFIAWFFLCVVLTVANIWNIGNVAHGSGAVLGALLGFVIAEKNKQRRLGYVSLLTVSMLVIFAASSVGRKYVNFSGAFQLEEERQAGSLVLEAARAHQENDFVKAAGLYSQALAISDSHADWWFLLGICYEQMHEEKKALHAFRQAALLKPDNETYKKALEQFSPPE
jgi:membrane associated rhomboid family serine protease